MSQRLFANLKSYLTEIRPVQDYIGAGEDARFYKSYARQGVPTPYVVCHVFEGTSEEHLGGISGLASNRVELNCYADNSEDAYELAEAIRLAPLQSLRGTMANLFVASVTSTDGYQEGADAPAKDGDHPRFWVMRDYIIHYHEPIAA